MPPPRCPAWLAWRRSRPAAAHRLRLPPRRLPAAQAAGSPSLGRRSPVEGGVGCRHSVWAGQGGLGRGGCCACDEATPLHHCNCCGNLDTNVGAAASSSPAPAAHPQLACAYSCCRPSYVRPCCLMCAGNAAHTCTGKAAGNGAFWPAKIAPPAAHCTSRVPVLPPSLQLSCTRPILSPCRHPRPCRTPTAPGGARLPPLGSAPGPPRPAAPRG